MEVRTVVFLGFCFDSLPCGAVDTVMIPVPIRCIMESVWLVVSASTALKLVSSSVELVLEGRYAKMCKAGGPWQSDGGAAAVAPELHRVEWICGRML